MKVSNFSTLVLAGLLVIGTASAQTAPAGQDSHHPAPEAGSSPAAEDSAAEEAAPVQGQMAPTAGPDMMNMMSPEMMQMMMQMMKLHHASGQMSMPGMAGGMQSGMAGMMNGQGTGPDVVYGMAQEQPEEMTPERVRTWLQERLDRLGNPRLTLGAIGEATDGSITAEIRTTDGALVQRLAFNRYPGFVRQID